MNVSYKKLWKLLIDKDMMKKDLQKEAGISWATQDEVINECYVKIGTGKELEQAGILTKGGLFKKRKVNYSGFASAGFRKVDIRHLTEISISGKKAKILTGAPAGSYSIASAGKNKWIIHITNPTSFWSVSNYLVIQTD